MNRAWQAFFGRGLVATRRGLRDPGRAADPPRAARLAGDRVPPPGLEPEGDAPADRHQRDLPASRRRRRPTCSPATPGTSCWPGARGSGSTPRWSATSPCRPAACSTRRSAARASSRPSPTGVTSLAYGQVGLADQPGAGPLPPGALHLHQADRPVRRLRHLRRPDLRGRLRPPRAVEHAAPGPHPAERPGLRRGRPGPRPAGRRRRAAPTPRAGPGSPSGSASAGSRPADEVGLDRRLPGPAGRPAPARASSTPRKINGADGRGRPGRAGRWATVARALLNLDETITKE